MNTGTFSMSFDIPWNTCIHGNAGEVLRDFPPSTFDLCVTSPPYLNLRNYGGDSREIGQEKTQVEYISNLISLFDVVWDKLKPTGSLWVNLGETFVRGPLHVTDNFLRMMTEVASWHHMQTIIWYKPDPQPESAQRRFSQTWEPFYWFVKDYNSYYFNIEASKIAVKKNTINRLYYKFNKSEQTAVSRMRGIVENMEHKVDDFLTQGVNAGDLWIIPTNKDPVKHPAPYPKELIIRPIVACCPDGGNILDPFCGSGTTVLTAVEMGRKAVGIDLNKEYVDLTNSRVESRPSKDQLQLF